MAVKLLVPAQLLRNLHHVTKDAVLCEQVKNTSSLEGRQTKGGPFLSRFLQILIYLPALCYRSPLLPPLPPLPPLLLLQQALLP